MNQQRAERFLKQLQKPGRFKLFMLAKLPLAFIAGLRLENADLERFHKQPYQKSKRKIEAVTVKTYEEWLKMMGIGNDRNQYRDNIL